MAHMRMHRQVLLTPRALEFTSSKKTKSAGPPCRARDLSCFFESLTPACDEAERQSGELAAAKAAAKAARLEAAGKGPGKGKGHGAAAAAASAARAGEEKALPWPSLARSLTQVRCRGVTGPATRPPRTA